MEIDVWLEERIKTQEDKIKEAMTKSWGDVKLRAEGYLEALYCIQDFVTKDKSSRHHAVKGLS